MKITNQLIQSCKDAINGQDAPEKIWDKDSRPLLEILEQTLRWVWIPYQALPGHWLYISRIPR